MRETVRIAAEHFSDAVQASGAQIVLTDEQLKILERVRELRSHSNFSAAELVRSMSQGTSDQSTKPSEIVFTDYYRFPDTYPSAVNQMDEISHSLRVTFRTPSGAQYFFHVVTPTYKLFNLKLPFSDSDSDDLQGTEGSFLDSGTASLDQVRSLDLCAPMKIDGRSDGRFGR
ncbi:MAG: hypothetical protein J0L82_05500 [Deltaproteobacteria bacterium]|nr:hypothetical protein [Deltaproteobacteria bacterium]